MAELQRLQNDPNFVLEVAAGPPAPALVAQDPHNASKGIIAFGKFVTGKESQRFIIKKAHLSTDDWRIFDASSGKLVYNAHHPGANPLEGVDVLGTAPQSNMYGYGGEWESQCDVTGHNGYPSFCIRPKTLSRHGCQYIRDTNGKDIMNIVKESKIKTQSIRANYAVYRGDSRTECEYRITGDLMERTLQVFNEDNEQVAFIQKSAKSLIMNATLGAGSEMLIDVAPGVDTSTMCMIVIGLKQVGQSVVKDLTNNWIADPFKNAAMDKVIDNTGELGQTAVRVNNAVAGNANMVADNGHGRHLPAGLKVPPDMKKAATNYFNKGR